MVRSALNTPLHKVDQTTITKIIVFNTVIIIIHLN